MIVLTLTFFPRMDKSRWKIDQGTTVNPRLLPVSLPVMTNDMFLFRPPERGQGISGSFPNYAFTQADFVHGTRHNAQHLQSRPSLAPPPRFHAGSRPLPVKRGRISSPPSTERVSRLRNPDIICHRCHGTGHPAKFCTTPKVKGYMTEHQKFIDRESKRRSAGRMKNEHR